MSDTMKTQHEENGYKRFLKDEARNKKKTEKRKAIQESMEG